VLLARQGVTDDAVRWWPDRGKALVSAARRSRTWSLPYTCHIEMSAKDYYGGGGGQQQPGYDQQQQYYPPQGGPPPGQGVSAFSDTAYSSI
jgi:hypothetical protein